MSTINWNRLHSATQGSLTATPFVAGGRMKTCGCVRTEDGNSWVLCSYHDGFDRRETAAVTDPVCQFCGEAFPEPAPERAGGKPRVLRSRVAAHADHELRCPENPDRPVKLKTSAAWSPMPWTHKFTDNPQPKPTAVVFVGGPNHGRVLQWINYLVDGSVVAVEPPLTMSGPVMADSKGRAASRYMGHYRLKLSRDCPVYVWVDTIVPKKRLPQPIEFTKAWPDLAASLEQQQPMEVSDGAGTDDGSDDRGPDPVPLEVLG